MPPPERRQSLQKRHTIRLPILSIGFAVLVVRRPGAENRYTWGQHGEEIRGCGRLPVWRRWRRTSRGFTVFIAETVHDSLKE